MMFFKSGKLLYFALGIVFLGSALLTTFWDFPLKASALLFEFLLFFIFALLIAVFYTKKYNRLVESCLNSCDPQFFIEQMDSCLQNSGSWSKYSRIAQLGRSSALIAGGWFEVAIQELTQLDRSKFSRPAYGAQLGGLLNNLALAYRWGDDPASANAALNDLEQLLQNPDIHLNTRQQLQRHAVSRRYEAWLFEGQAQGAEEYFASALQVSATKMERVNNLFYLGWAQLINGKKEEAARTLQLVVSEAPKLFIAQRAREMLEQMRPDAPAQS